MSEFIYTLPSHNRAASYSHIRVTPTTGAIGADVENLDLTRLSDEGFAELRQALLAQLRDSIQISGSAARGIWNSASISSSKSGSLSKTDAMAFSFCPAPLSYDVESTMATRVRLPAPNGTVTRTPGRTAVSNACGTLYVNGLSNRYVVFSKANCASKAKTPFTVN